MSNQAMTAKDCSYIIENATTLLEAQDAFLMFELGHMTDDVNPRHQLSKKAQEILWAINEAELFEKQCQNVGVPLPGFAQQLLQYITGATQNVLH